MASWEETSARLMRGHPEIMAAIASGDTAHARNVVHAQHRRLLRRNEPGHPGRQLVRQNRQGSAGPQCHLGHIQRESRETWSRDEFRRCATLHPLMQYKKPEFNARRRRLAAATSIYDLRTIAKRVTPRAAFDYTDGAAEGEISLARARQAFQDIEFHPSVLRDVSAVDTSREVLGRTSAMPFGIAPTGFTRMMQTEGERAGATAAAAAGIPLSLSTMGTTSIEDVAAAAPDGRHWFHLYM